MSIHSVFEDQVSPSLFEGINARHYKTAEVARNFVPNEQFDNLAVRQHHLVVGPRGSGKTTLLRMLHPEALGLWRHPAADAYRERVDFSGIYVSTDRVWREQVESAASGVSTLDRDAFAATVVALDVMSAMVKTLEARLTMESDTTARFRPVVVERAEVARLVAELAAGWGIEPQFLDLGSLRVSLRARRMEARRWIRALAAEPSEVERPGWLGITWDDALSLAIDAYESVTHRSDELWAVLFDEIEIAPVAVRDAILGATRGMDPRILLKCSLSPWLQGSPTAITDIDGTVFHDFNVIRLFYGRRTEAYEFSRRLIASRLASAGHDVGFDRPVEEVVFGESQFAASVGGRSSRTAPAYTDDSNLGRVVKDLSLADPNFRQWLADNEIDPDNLDSVSEKSRAETLRKARNYMIARLEFRRASGLLRSRKTLAMYAGGATMLDICEGNPRLLLGLLLPLLEFFDGQHPIPQTLQADAIGQISADFYALVDAIPVTSADRSPAELRGRELRNPYREFIDRVARYFQDDILRGPFNPQPATTFRMPRSTSSELQGIVGRLVNIGALVMIPDRGVKDTIVQAFDQQRVRLCYLVAAREHLPPNVDRPVSVRRVLARRTTARPPGAAPIPGLEADETEEAE